MSVYFPALVIKDSSSKYHSNLSLALRQQAGRVGMWLLFSEQPICSEPCQLPRLDLKSVVNVEFSLN